MAQSIGEYAISVKTDAREFQKGMEQVVVTTQRATNMIVQASSATTQIAVASKNTTFAIQQLALGVQDAASVFGTGGFSGALRAAGNNLVQFASIMSPMSGTMAAFAVTGLQVMADQFTRTGDAAKKAAESVLLYTNNAEKLSRDIKAGRAVSDNTDVETSGEARSNAKRLQKEFEDARQLEFRSRTELNNLRDLMDQTRERIGAKSSFQDRLGNNLQPLTAEAGKQRLDDLNKQQDALRKQADEQERMAKELQAQRDAAIKQEAELVRQEYDKAFQQIDGERAKRAQEMARKEAESLVAKEKGRQELIAESRREEFAENQRRAQMMRAVQPNFQYAGYGSAEAAEALARSRTTVADDAKNYYDKSLGIQENMLDQLVELNKAQQEANVDVIEDFLFQ